MIQEFIGKTIVQNKNNNKIFWIYKIYRTKMYDNNNTK